MIGNTLLNQNIIVKNLDQPSQVLAAIDEDVRQGLKQAESNNRDGMDLLLCKLIPKENGYYELTFSGAKCDLYYVKDGQLGKLRGDRRSMGGAQPNLKVKFTDQVLTLKHGDALYLTTDGWLDNCNLQRKRFGNKRLEDLIIAHHHQPLDIQKTIFTEALEAFQGEQEQRDDITLMAIKL
jgi:serine phosphatase RsbU (regulator of sigma subunit)